ncbi:MAG: hypothetical protein K2O88_08000 [Paramuribaculum sp.]|nr:hypothetical protein [Paramuribaculum sp.]
MSAVTRSILLFMLKAVAVVLPVVAVAVAWYVNADPFKVLGHYDCYLPDPVKYPVRVGINKGLITVTNFHDRLAEGRNYDAFIFGSSVSCYYDARTWASLADTTGLAGAYHFDSSGETLTAMADKVRYLHSIDQPIRYALVVLDPIIMAGDNTSGPAVVNPPQLHKSLCERIKYHYTFFRAATNADFFKSWIPYLLTGKAYANGRNLLFEPQPIVYDPAVNQEAIPQWDSVISVDPQAFYAEYPLIPSPDTVTVSPAVITPVKAEALRSIAEVFAAHGTDYKIIIGPNRNKVALNPADLQLMRQIFVPECVYDFSADMAYELECDTMLYDNTHYRPAYALRLMLRAYGK